MAISAEEQNWGQRNSTCKDAEDEKISYYEICIIGGQDALQS